MICVIVLCSRVKRRGGEDEGKSAIYTESRMEGQLHVYYAMYVHVYTAVSIPICTRTPYIVNALPHYGVNINININ